MPQAELYRRTTPPRREWPTEFTREGETKQRPPSVTIGRPVDEVFAFVRDFANFPKFMRGLKEAKVLAAKVAHLSFDHEGVVGDCDVERLSEVRDQMVAWKTLGDTTLDHAGVFTVEPAPGNRGTVISLKMNFEDEMPGKVRGMISYFFGHDPKSEAYVNLRRLKAYLETGEVPTIQGQPSGRDQ